MSYEWYSLSLRIQLSCYKWNAIIRDFLFFHLEKLSSLCHFSFCNIKYHTFALSMNGGSSLIQFCKRKTQTSNYRVICKHLPRWNVGPYMSVNAGLYELDRDHLTHLYTLSALRQSCTSCCDLSSSTLAWHAITHITACLKPQISKILP